MHSHHADWIGPRCRASSTHDFRIPPEASKARHEARLLRTRSHQQHVTTNHIPQLGQLIEMRPSEELSGGNNSMSSTSANTGPDWSVMVRILNSKSGPPTTNAVLPKEKGPGTPRTNQTKRMLNKMNALEPREQQQGPAARPQADLDPK